MFFVAPRAGSGERQRADEQRERGGLQGDAPADDAVPPCLERPRVGRGLVRGGRTGELLVDGCCDPYVQAQPGEECDAAPRRRARPAAGDSERPAMSAAAAAARVPAAPGNGIRWSAYWWMRPAAWTSAASSRPANAGRRTIAANTSVPYTTADVRAASAARCETECEHRGLLISDLIGVFGQLFAGIAPICWKNSRLLSSSQCSCSRPPRMRQMSIDCISICAPLGGMPMKVPVWRPR